VAIDVETPRSPGWWMQRLSRKLTDKKRLERLCWLDRYYEGDLDLPVAAPAAEEAYRLFQRKTRSNFAELVVAAVREREALVGFRTKADSDETGDKIANELWRKAEGDVFAADIHLMCGKFGEAWALVGDIDDETEAPLLTAEDPRNMVGECDPANPRRTIAAFKSYFDELDEVSKAYLYLHGQVVVATSPNRRGATAEPFNPQTWSIDTEASASIDGGRMPAIRYEVNDGAGEFERHKDLLDRITDQILQRMSIAVMQAFRQRAVRGLPDKYTDGPKIGKLIDYSGLFTADPAAIWQLPATAEMWESGVVDLSGILNATKDDVGHLAAVTRTPMYMLMPEGANQSAEGASTAKEGLVFKVQDRILRLTPSHARTMSNMLQRAGETNRAALGGIRPIWRSPERRSLAERADAAVKATDVPWRTKMIKIWEFDPDEVDRMEAERVDDIMLEQQFAAAAAAAQPAPTPPGGQPVPPNPAGQPSPQDNTTAGVNGAPVPAAG
jgi:hypothetical protein